MLQRLGPQMRQAAQQVVMEGVTLGRHGRPRGASLAGWQRLSDDRRNARLALYEQVMSLRTQGCTMKAIGRELSIDHRTVSKFVRAGCFPERAARARCVTPLDAHRSYIEDRVAQGCRCPRQIWQEVRDRGYTGSRAVVQHCVTRLLYPQGKTALVEAPVRTMPCPSESATHERFVQALCAVEPVVVEVRSLARQFLGLMHRRNLREFDRWLERLSSCAAPEMQSVAAGLRADLPAVRAAFSSPWSNGQTEGHVNRLKFLKRQMYGRASVELLRLRVLNPN